MREMLEMVTQPGGSAVKAQVPGYRVGGKTGTAQKVSAAATRTPNTSATSSAWRRCRIRVSSSPS
jgi:cell division protein FtsI/penicillin-binding protein 2